MDFRRFGLVRCGYVDFLKKIFLFIRRENGHGDGDNEIVEDNVSVNDDHANLNTPSTSKKRKLAGKNLTHPKKLRHSSYKRRTLELSYEGF